MSGEPVQGAEMTSPARRRVCHVITGLSTGGAEMMLWKLISAMQDGSWDSQVLSLLASGPIADRIAALGVPVASMEMQRGVRAALRAPVALRAAIRQKGPDILQGWMYHGNLAALLGRPSRATPVIWNIRASFEGFHWEKASTNMMIRAGAMLSCRTAHIVYNSRLAARQHEGIGYTAERTIIIPNGFDTDKFRPSELARLEIRRRLSLPADTILVGHVARFHPMKNQEGFIRAAAAVCARREDVAFIMAGDGIDDGNATLVEQVRASGVGNRVHFLGRVDDTASLMAGLDVLCNPSWVEAFPNVLGEAMSCGVPCVSTDVGDSAWIVGDSGLITPRNEPSALAEAIETLLALTPEDRMSLGHCARDRVIREFALPEIAARYTDLYERTLDERR